MRVLGTMVLLALAAGCGWARGQTAPGGAGGKVTCHPGTAPASAAEVALAQGKYADATQLYGEDAAAHEEGRAGMVRTLLAQNKLADAETLARTWVAEKPGSAVAQETLGEVQYRKADLPGAYASLQTANTLDVCDARVYLMKAEMEALTANFADSSRHVALAHQLAPLDLEITAAWLRGLPSARRETERPVSEKANPALSASTVFLQRASLYTGYPQAASFDAGECTVSEPVNGVTISMSPIQPNKFAPRRMGIEMTINGHKRKLQLDSGASGITLSKASATKLNIVEEQQRMVSGVGDNGTVKTVYGHAEEIKIGGLTFHHCPVEVLANDISGSADDGLVGADLFSRYLVTLNFPDEKIRLDALPARPAGSDEIGNRYVAPEMKDWTKIYRVGHELLVLVGFGDGKEKLFLADTGADALLISPQAAREVTKLDSDSQIGIGGIGGLVKKVYTARDFVLHYGNLAQAIQNMTSIDMTGISRDDGIEVSGFLGFDLLKHETLQIDYRDNLMKFVLDPKHY